MNAVPSRRDDLEAVALMLIHLLTPGGLSWTRNGVPKTDVAHDQLKRAKEHARPPDLCHGLPSEFEEFLRYCRRLGFQERPDYSRWVEAFRDLAVEQGFGDSDAFVWPPVVEVRFVLLLSFCCGIARGHDALTMCSLDIAYRSRVGSSQSASLAERGGERP